MIKYIAGIMAGVALGGCYEGEVVRQHVDVKPKISIEQIVKPVETVVKPEVKKEPDYKNVCNDQEHSIRKTYLGNGLTDNPFKQLRDLAKGMGKPVEYKDDHGRSHFYKYDTGLSLPETPIPGLTIKVWTKGGKFRDLQPGEKIESRNVVGSFGPVSENISKCIFDYKYEKSGEIRNGGETAFTIDGKEEFIGDHPKWKPYVKEVINKILEREHTFYQICKRKSSRLDNILNKELLGN